MRIKLGENIPHRLLEPSTVTDLGHGSIRSRKPRLGQHAHSSAADGLADQQSELPAVTKDLALVGCAQPGSA